MKKFEIFTTENGTFAFYVYQVMKSTHNGAAPLFIISYSSEESAQSFCDVSNMDNMAKELDEFYFVHPEMVIIK